MLLGADAALDDGVDRLQVAGVGRQRQVDLVALAADAVAGEAEVVLHVAVAGHRVGQVVFLELGEDLGVGLAEDVGQDVEPAAVGHAEDDLANAVVGGHSTMASSTGISVSAPSREKRFWPR